MRFGGESRLTDTRRRQELAAQSTPNLENCVTVTMLHIETTCGAVIGAGLVLNLTFGFCRRVIELTGTVRGTCVR